MGCQGFIQRVGPPGIPPPPRKLENLYSLILYSCMTLDATNAIDISSCWCVHYSRSYCNSCLHAVEPLLSGHHVASIFPALWPGIKAKQYLIAVRDNLISSI